MWRGVCTCEGGDVCGEVCVCVRVVMCVVRCVRVRL